MPAALSMWCLRWISAILFKNQTIEETGVAAGMWVCPITAVVRPPVNDTVIIKQHLDLGVQSLLVPMVHAVADSEAAVAAGTGSGAAPAVSY